MAFAKRRRHCQCWVRRRRTELLLLLLPKVLMDLELFGPGAATVHCHGTYHHSRPRC